MLVFFDLGSGKVLVVSAHFLFNRCNAFIVEACKGFLSLVQACKDGEVGFPVLLDDAVTLFLQVGNVHTFAVLVPHFVALGCRPCYVSILGSILGGLCAFLGYTFQL